MLAQLEAAPLLRRLDLATKQLLCVRGTLAPPVDSASGAGSTRPDTLGFLDLPHAVALHILSFVPADACARAALVCRAWRDTIADTRLWTVLDLSPASGVAQPVSDATLRGAAALAAGRLTVLCLDDCNAWSVDALLEVVRLNATTLRELSRASVEWFGVDGATIQELVDTAPQLAALKIGVHTTVAEGTRMLQNESPFGALQLCNLSVIGEPFVEAEFLALCASVSAHAPLRMLEVRATLLSTPAIDALSAAALSESRILWVRPLAGVSASTGTAGQGWNA